MKIRAGGGVFDLGNPGGRGVTVIQEIQVGWGGQKTLPSVGGVDFFWNNPFHGNDHFLYCLVTMPKNY